tara:strand:+ start:350 stop:598 length:249 start_codon:yes stop_codon:yes gene_type:complete
MLIEKNANNMKPYQTNLCFNTRERDRTNEIIATDSARKTGSIYRVLGRTSASMKDIDITKTATYHKQNKKQIVGSVIRTEFA